VQLFIPHHTAAALTEGDRNEDRRLLVADQVVLSHRTVNIAAVHNLRQARLLAMRYPFSPMASAITGTPYLAAQPRGSEMAMNFVSPFYHNIPGLDSEYTCLYCKHINKKETERCTECGAPREEETR
jgi:hypothetical protein